MTTTTRALTDADALVRAFIDGDPGTVSVALAGIDHAQAWRTASLLALAVARLAGSDGWTATLARLDDDLPD